MNVGKNGTGNNGTGNNVTGKNGTGKKGHRNKWHILQPRKKWHTVYTHHLDHDKNRMISETG